MICGGVQFTEESAFTCYNLATSPAAIGKVFNESKIEVERKKNANNFV